MDLQKAYVEVPGGILWRVLWDYNVSEPFMHVVRSLYTLSERRVCMFGIKDHCTSSPCFMLKQNRTSSCAGQLSFRSRLFCAFFNLGWSYFYLYSGQWWACRRKMNHETQQQWQWTTGLTFCLCFLQTSRLSMWWRSSTWGSGSHVSALCSPWCLLHYCKTPSSNHLTTLQLRLTWLMWISTAKCEALRSSYIWLWWLWDQLKVKCSFWSDRAIVQDLEDKERSQL